MIIGNGMLANSLKPFDEENIVVFASGVSNSLETKDSEFDREIKLLRSTVEKFPNKKLIYFSTCSIYDLSKVESPYVMHKLKVEEIISKICPHYTIFRVGNAVGSGGNPNTLINFLENSIRNGQVISLHNNARRVLIGVDDIAKLVSQNLKSFDNKIVNIVYPHQFQLIEVVSTLEKHLQLKAKYELVDEGSAYNMDFDEIMKSYFQGISPEEYLQKLYTTYL